MGKRGEGNEDHTVQGGGDPVEDGAPQVDPPDELQIVRRVVLVLDEVEYRLVQHRYGSFFRAFAFKIKPRVRGPRGEERHGGGDEEHASERDKI